MTPLQLQILQAYTEYLVLQVIGNGTSSDEPAQASNSGD